MVHVVPSRLGLSVDPQAVEWRATASEGVEWALLASHGGPGRGATVLIRMAPGRGYPAHRHQGAEEVLVLAGGYSDAEGTYRAGDFVRYEAGSAHAPVALGRAGEPTSVSNPACILFASAPGGIEPLTGPRTSHDPVEAGGTSRDS